MHLAATEHLFEEISNWIAIGLEGVAILIIGYAALQALVGIFRPAGPANDFFLGRKRTWMKFAFWIMMALQFALAADLVRTAITPTWDELGQLVVIAVIRTFLNYFLQRDVIEYSEKEFGPADEFRKSSAAESR